MSIQDIPQKINRFLDMKHTFWTVTIFGLTFLVVGLIGQSLQAKTAEGIIITAFEGPVFNEQHQKPITKDTVYASKSGTRYYFEDCSGLKRIKPENRVSFASPALAEQAGYTKAANCH